MILSQPSTSDEEGVVAPGDHALGTAEVGATGLARVLWPLPHRVMVCWGGWKPEGPVGGLTLVEVLQP